VAIGRLAAEHLLERGFSHFGWCGVVGVNWAQTRRDSFEQTVGAAGCPCEVYRLPARTRSDSSWEIQQEQLAHWLRRLPKPSGVMACYDPAGQRVLEACRRAEVLVPDEVAVIGVDNDQTVCEVCDPPLSSVAANHFQVGQEAAALLDRLMRSEPSLENPLYVAPAGVVTRQSSDVLAIGDPDVVAALHFIRERACGGIQVQEVTEHVSVSRSTLKERFRCLLGRSIHDEIIRVRINRCRELLSQTKMPIRKIAEKTGFRHQEYMGVVFKEIVGKTPGQYRKETQQ
jgi:LacI family transcriptional regulator